MIKRLFGMWVAGINLLIAVAVAAAGGIATCAFVVGLPLHLLFGDRFAIGLWTGLAIIAIVPLFVARVLSDEVFYHAGKRSLRPQNASPSPQRAQSISEA